MLRLNRPPRAFIFIGLSLALSGCASNLIETSTTQSYFRGLLNTADDSLRIRDCDAFNWRVFEPKDAQINGRLLKRLSKLPQGVGIYLEAWGEPNDPIQEIQMLGGDLATCQHRLPGATIRAGGLNPIWYADLKQGALQVHNSTGLRSWNLTQTEFRRVGERWVWQSEDIRLSIWPKTCIDAIGIEYALSAEFTGPGTRLTGCARYGDIDRALLKTRYYSRDANQLRQLGLQLWADDRVDLSLISRDGSRERYSGRWQVLNSGQLLLRFDDERLRGQSRSLRLLRQEDKLKILTPHPVFGEGALLYPGSDTLLSQQRSLGAIP